MQTITTIGLDIAKSLFQVHGVDAGEHVMQCRSIRRSGQPTRLGPWHLRMRAFDRDLIRGGHYGQRSCEPRKQAEHMAAPTNAAT